MRHPSRTSHGCCGGYDRRWPVQVAAYHEFAFSCDHTYDGDEQGDYSEGSAVGRASGTDGAARAGALEPSGRTMDLPISMSTRVRAHCINMMDSYIIMEPSYLDLDPFP